LGPHCDEHILIEKINCAIFRHAVIKTNGNQLNPHSNKTICDNLILNNAIYGCGKPFKVIKNPEYIIKTNIDNNNKEETVDNNNKKEVIDNSKEETVNNKDDDIEEYIAIICEYI